MSQNSSTLPISIIFVGILILIYQNFTSHVKTDVEQVVQPTVTEKELKKVKKPANGYMKNYSNRKLVAPLIITAPVSQSVLVKIVDPYTLQPILSVFVRENNTARIYAPLGEYVLKYAMGKNWYGFDNLFGNETIYLMANEKMDFIRNQEGYIGRKIILRPMLEGNLHTEEIPAKNF